MEGLRRFRASARRCHQTADRGPSAARSDPVGLIGIAIIRGSIDETEKCPAELSAGFGF